METLFENSYVRNREIAKEMYCYYYFKRKRFIFFSVFLGAFFLWNLYTAIFNGSYIIFYFLALPLYLAAQIYLYFYQVNTLVKRDREYSDEPISINITVTEEYICGSSSVDSGAKLKYDKILRAAETKNLILINTKANLIYTLKKDSFTKGNKEDFMEFLKKKGIRIK